jgi:urease accessory protein
MSSPDKSLRTTRGESILLILMLLLATLFSQPVLAHHPLGMDEVTPLSPVYGLLSGLAHPVIGFDHAFFLISIAFIGLTSLRSWVLPLLGVGLAGSFAAQVINPALLPSGLHVVVALSIGACGLVALKRLPPSILLPLMFLHGFALGEQIRGNESTPIILYFIGLFLSQAVLLMISTYLSGLLHHHMKNSFRTYFAWSWIGLGTALAWYASKAA